MKKTIIGLLLIMPLIAWSQKSDSLKIYSLPKWKLDRLLQSHFYTLPACDSTVKSFQAALDSAKKQLNTADKMIQLKEFESDTWQKRFDNMGEIQKQDLKASRKKGRREGAIGAGGIGLILLILALYP